jgi:hypothetical protein
MSRTFLFFHPARLPLETADLSESTVLSLQDSPDLRAKLEQVFAGLSWQTEHIGQVTAAGNWYEVSVPKTPVETLAVRCSLRTDHAPFIQDICNRLGWLAFDDRPTCFQPNRAPIPA